MVYTIRMSIDPQSHDEATAALYFELDEAQRYLARATARVIRSAGVKEHRFGKDTKRGWGSEDEYYSYDEAVERVEDKSLLGEVDHAEAEVASLDNAIFAAEAKYTGWSRFFLVTSSTGHIHSSMRCDTCYNTTTYGWLPELSGLPEAHAVIAHGEVLCTHCFPSAPTSKKISAAKAATLAWSPDRDEKRNKAHAACEAKEAAKIAKAARALKSAESLAHKVNKLVDQFGDDIRAEYEWTFDHKGFDTAHYVHADMKRKQT
jgi:hypothetical protein